MEHNTFHKALEIQPELCIGCSHCIKVCPTEALRVSGGKALLYADWCIDCGRCFRVCPSRAIRVVDDDFDSIYSYKYRVLLVPAVFYAQFEKSIPRRIINDILGDMGFSEVCTVEQSVDTLVDEINDYVHKAEDKPVISSFCPAVIRLIQVRFPSLIDRIMLLLPPIEVTAQYYVRKWKMSGGDPSELGVFYLTPCIAKIAAVKSQLPNTEIAILTGYRDFDYAQKAITLGVCRLLLKPSKMDEIYEALDFMTKKLDEKGIEEREQKTAAGAAENGALTAANAAVEGYEPADSAANSFLVKNALRYIESHYQEKLRLSDVADSVFVSQWHLSKLLNKYTGKNFSEILNGVRIEKAKELLKSPALRVCDIAEKVGFLDIAHFSRVFKKTVGISANDYRNSL